MDVSRLDFMKAAALGLVGAAVADCTTSGATCCPGSTAAPKEPPPGPAARSLLAGERPSAPDALGQCASAAARPLAPRRRAHDARDPCVGAGDVAPDQVTRWWGMVGADVLGGPRSRGRPRGRPRWRGAPRTSRLREGCHFPPAGESGHFRLHD